MIDKGETLLWSWLHLSDIHFDHGNEAYGADQKLVLSRLIQDMTDKAIPASITPEAVLVTGDIAFSGGARSAAEYVQATRYLSEIQNSLGGVAALMMVPGNHDAQRVSGTSSRLGKLVARLRKGDLYEVDEAAVKPKTKDQLVSRFANYVEFAGDVHALDASPIFWHQVLDTPAECRIHVLGINTALLANDDYDAGKLGVVRAGIDNALVGVKRGDVVVMMSHHPFTWLTDGDKAYLESRADNYAHIHLHGHIHMAENSLTRHANGLGRVSIIAGAVHGDQPQQADDSPVPHRYSIAALVQKPDGSIELRIHLRKWIGRWTTDADNHLPGRNYGALRVVEAPQPETRVKKTSAQSFTGMALRANSSSAWLLPVHGPNGPELCPAPDAYARARALISPAGTLLAQQTGTRVSVAATSHLGTSTQQWPSTFELGAGDEAVALVEASEHDAALVVSSDSGTRLILLERDTGRLGAERWVDDRRARCAVVDRGHVLVATWEGSVATCPAFTGLADVERIDAASRGGSTLVLAVGHDHGGEGAAYLLLTSERWKGLSRLRKRRRTVGAIGVDLLASEPTIVGEATATTWRSMQRDSQIVTHDRWVKP